ncbi:MAG: hypothetical protein CFK52_07495 [Chloracidobacterium sp. CP2_5A]|nr:MAG: hypothetical protein CFK52_07495 [Chloracidobacterium sp. CP2_5A]
MRRRLNAFFEPARFLSELAFRANRSDLLARNVSALQTLDPLTEPSAATPPWKKREKVAQSTAPPKS